MPRILVLDEDEPLRLTLGEALEGAGHDVRLAASRMEAYEMLGVEPVELILTNVGRLLDDQLDLSQIHLLRQRAHTAKIIIFTGHSQARRLNLDSLGVAAVLLKPADLDEILDTINIALD